ncbi:glutathione S-transferase-like protein [Vararia minispora EC-137]|uniref:Glutathione S-transferase-like protein n=1 Tax=Vararia minispora EC-137 TaxID=1314806 RepID=A0ACB8QU37_9AGAM|nr:glutathione S-transferase-like protein [Vararia minispora EC-137]
MSSNMPLKLYTARTPSGFKVTIMLEELKAAYPEVDYEAISIDISRNEQKQDWYLKLNPNAVIPTLVDCSREDFIVTESSAILLYLVQHYDREMKFTFDPVTEADDYSEMLQWIFFVHGGVGPMEGQIFFFKYLSPEKIPYAIDRYVNETKRLYSVVEIRLKDRDWLAGPGRGKFSVADCNLWAWVRMHGLTVAQTLDEWPALKAWSECILARPAALAGANIPPEGNLKY